MSMFPQTAATQSFVASQPAFLRSMPGAYNPVQGPQAFTGSTTLPGQSGGFIPASSAQQQQQGGNLLSILKNKETNKFDPFKTSAAIAAGTYLSGAFDPPTNRYLHTRIQHGST